MPTLIYIIIFTTLASLLGLVGGAVLLTRKKLSHKITHGLAAFAAGVLLGTAFLDLLPEAFHHFEELGMVEVEKNVFLLTLVGIILFFLLERFIHWFHHHHRDHQEEALKPIVPLIVFGDGVHNFIDGVIIAATFMIDIRLGIITTIAIIAHEIPQEIGDFGLLLHQGVKKSQAFLYNLYSQLTCVVGGVAAFFVGSSIEGVLPYLIAITSGFFIYIALSDLVPDIHSENKKGFAVLESGLLIVGISFVYVSSLFLSH